MNSDIRFYLDEHISKALLAALRRHGHDVLSVKESHLIGEADATLLAFATSEGRVLITQDQDFLKLHAQGVQHAGVLYFPQHTPTRILIEATLLVAGVMSAEEMVNRVEYP